MGQQEEEEERDGQGGGMVQRPAGCSARCGASHCLFLGERVTTLLRLILLACLWVSAAAAAPRNGAPPPNWRIRGHSVEAGASRRILRGEGRQQVREELTRSWYQRDGLSAGHGERRRRLLQATDQTGQAQILLNWRAGFLEGPKRVFADWNLTTEPNFCSWRGVTCMNVTQQQYVTSINLAGSKLSGSISPGLAGLPFLDTLDLSYNRLTGEIPADLANTSTLRVLNLAWNRLNGSIPAFGANSSGLQSLNLTRNGLSGGVPASVGQCTKLTELNLGRNVLEGEIPSELGALANLTTLLLNDNRLDGALPSSLSRCTQLVNVSLRFNQLAGDIPAEFSALTALRGLYLQGNKLSGDIPEWVSVVPALRDLHLDLNRFGGPIPAQLGNSTALQSLNLSNNALVGSIPSAIGRSAGLLQLDLSANLLNGSIPEEFGSLTRMQRLHLDRNRLTEFIPTSLEKCSELREIVLSENRLGGPIIDLASFTRLDRLSLAGNMLNGTIPQSVGNCTNLTRLDLSDNGLVGAIPTGVGQLVGLTALNLSFNSLGGEVPDLSALMGLQNLSLDHNLLGDGLPTWFGDLAQLQVLSLGTNQFSGPIPSQLSQCIGLTTLALDDNDLNGTIPDFLGQLPSLSVLRLNGNRLTGTIPTGFSNFTSLRDLSLSDNALTGGIPASLLPILSQLDSNFSLANNHMEGSLPPALGLLTRVSTLNLSGNAFSGVIPDEIGNCTALQSLDLSSNDLTGAIPASLARLASLDLLNVSYNNLTGVIPADLGRLSGLDALDLSHNNVSGEIPTSLANLQNLTFLNVSDNSLSGPVPSFPLNRFTAASFSGNRYLCGAILQVDCNAAPPPGNATVGSNSGGGKSLSTAAWIGISVGAFGFVGLIVATAFLWRKVAPWGRDAPQKRGSIIARSELFYPQLRFTAQDLRQATENFSDVNLLGSGSLSKVYRGVLPELVLVAVKRLKLPGGTKIPAGFIDELDELGKLRHRNLVAILGYCFESDMNALVVQFMSNGSLEDHLHGGSATELEWPARARISVGIAKALTYLHHDCGSTIVHCDLKPSNVLLDTEYDAHLEDFGLSRLIFAHKLMDMTNSSVGSSMGYFPPEYGYSPTVSPKGDVYSFGILILELITGKKPSMESFSEDVSITTWCEAAFPNKILDVLDPVLVRSRETNFKQVTHYMKIALLCVRESPDERPTMKNVLDMLR